MLVIFLYYANNSAEHLTLQCRKHLKLLHETPGRLAQEWLQNLGQKLAELAFIRGWEYELLLSQIVQPLQASHLGFLASTPGIFPT